MDLHNIPTTLDKFYEWEAATPHQVYLKQPIDGKYLHFTWKDVGDEARRIAAAIHALKLPPKSNIALLSKNCAHWIITDLAIMMSGHISVPLYPNINATTLNYVLEHSEAAAIFVGKLDDWDSQKAGLTDTISTIALPQYYRSDISMTQWEVLLSEYEPIADSPKRDAHDLCTIIYTSGTTGKPKGVMHSFYNIGYAVTHAMTVVDVGGLGKGRFFSYLPLSHIAERMLIENGSIFTGGMVYFAESIDLFAKNLQVAQPTIFMAVPRIWTKFQQKIQEKLPDSRLNWLLKIPVVSTLLKNTIKKGLGLNRAIHTFTGAAPTPPALLRWYKKLGIDIQEVYGMTENCAYSHITRPNKVKIGSCGQPLPNVEVKISPDGEILVKSASNMIGYYKDKAKTLASFEGDYLKTGDEGHTDEEGFLFISGRTKDIFKTDKGKYVAPAPIEMELAQNSYIEQICVVGNQLPQPMALVVLSLEQQLPNRQELSSMFKQLLQKINHQLEKHEQLKKIVIVAKTWSIDNNLLTPTLKIKRREIEKQYQSFYKKWYQQEETVLWE